MVIKLECDAVLAFAIGTCVDVENNGPTVSTFYFLLEDWAGAVANLSNTLAGLTGADFFAVSFDPDSEYSVTL